MAKYGIGFISCPEESGKDSLKSGNLPLISALIWHVKISYRIHSSLKDLIVLR